MSLAPIIIFAFNRPDHFRQTWINLSKNRFACDSDLYIYLDGPRNKIDASKIQLVRQECDQISGFKSIKVINRHINFGLAKNIASGVSEVCQRHGKVIVLEDDMVTSPHFLKYMNDGLDFYHENYSVASIHGYVYPVQEKLPTTFFMRGADCWGWATWDRAWALYEPDGKKLLRQLYAQGLTRSFNLGDSHDYIAMLEDQIAGKNNSWAIRWHASIFLANKLTLYPFRSLVENIGTDDSGTHCGSTDTHNISLCQTEIPVSAIKEKPSVIAENAFGNFYRSLSRIRIRRLLQLKFNEKKWLFVQQVKQQRRLIKLTRMRKKGNLRIEGPYSDWSMASQASGGYAESAILDRVLSTTLAVKSGNTVAERDSVALDKANPVWPILSVLMMKASHTESVHVMDFGGSLGSTYFQHRDFLKHLPDLKWGVVEQVSFVEAGNQYIADDHLLFFEKIDDCIQSISPNIAILSSVLQYLQNPKEILKKIGASAVDVIVLDRTPISDLHDDVIGVQHVPESIYKASYPIHIFAKKTIPEALGSDWRLLDMFDALDQIPSPWQTNWKGFIYVRR